MKSTILAVSSLAVLFATSAAMAQAGPGPMPASAPVPEVVPPAEARHLVELPPARPAAGARQGKVGALLRHARAFVDAVLSGSAGDGEPAAAAPTNPQGEPASVVPAVVEPQGAVAAGGG